MAEIRRGIGADNRVERLPWLEPVEDEDDYPEAGNGRRWAAFAFALLALAALAVVGVVVARRWHGATQDIGGVIQPPPGPYKVRPADAGGLAVDQGGVVAEQTGTGADVDAPLALVAPEAPIVGPGSQPAGEPASPAQPRPAATVKTAPVVAPLPKPLPAPSAPAPTASLPAATPAPALPTTGGGTVQLGAFGSEAKARSAWKSLSRRFTYLQPMTVGITPAEVNGTKYFRLRASGGEAAGQICARLQVAGEACSVVG